MWRSWPRRDTLVTARLRFSHQKNASSSPAEWKIGPRAIRTSTSGPDVEGEELAVFLDRVTVGDAGDVVADDAGASRPVAAPAAHAPFARQDVGLGHEQLEHLRQDAPRLAAGAVD